MYERSVPHVIPFSLLTTPIIIDVILNQTCPLGFTLTGDPPHCNCYVELSKQLNCTVANGTGYIFREKNTWIGSNQNQMFFSSHCPYGYCKPDMVQVNLELDQNVQCASYRSGVLCGRCRDSNYSVAIGSSRCIPCPNNDNLALLIFFAAAGPLLYILLATVGLTITKGTINGLLFYANIVWISQNTIFSNTDQDWYTLQAPRAFIAWLNLDFGIEMCFIKELDAFGKCLLQYVFPIYIWITAAGVVAVYKCVNIRRLKQRYSILAVFKEDPVNVLVTFIFLSYTKIIRITSDALRPEALISYPDNKPSIVWTVDGTINYFTKEHIPIFIIGLLFLIATVIYTLYILVIGLKPLLLVCECKQTGGHDLQLHGNGNDERQNELENDKDHHLHCCSLTRRVISKLLKCMDMPLPVYNAHFASLVDKHRYWLGLMLLVRVILLITFLVTNVVAPDVNLLIILTVAIFLLLYITWNGIYVHKTIQMLQNLSLTNLIFLNSGILYADFINNNGVKNYVICISTGIAFLQFLGIICYCFVPDCIKEKYRNRCMQAYSTKSATATPNDNHCRLQGEQQRDINEPRESALEEDGEDDEGHPLI